jgi:hypothetical protein
MILRLDPRIPLVWRDPWTLQLGVDDVLGIVPDVTSDQLRLVGSLAVGVSVERLRETGLRLGVAAAEVDALLSALRPALRPRGPTRATAEPGSAPTVTVRDGRSDAVAFDTLLQTSLSAAGFLVLAPEADADLAVLVADWAVEPHRYRGLLADDAPHLPVVFGDATVAIGPLVVPGRSDCLACRERRHAEADDAWPALASQLVHRRAATRNAPVALAAAAEVVRLAEGWRDATDGGRGARLRLGGDREVSASRGPHPACGCAAPPGIVTAAAPRAAALSAPTTGAVHGEPA